MNKATREVSQTESPDSDSAEDKPGSLRLVWAFLVPFAYVLSIGPVAKFVAPKRGAC